MKTFYCALILLVFCACVPAVTAEETYAFVTAWGSLGSGGGQFNYPSGIALDGAGNIYVTDSGNNRIVKMATNGTVLTTWGNSGTGGWTV